jgi:transposase
MRFVPIKSSERQALLMQHKTRDLLVRQRTALINALRGEDIWQNSVSSRGPMGVRAAIEALRSAKDELPTAARLAFGHIRKQIEEFDVKIAELDRIILKWCRTDATARRLMTIPGVGSLTASVISASVGDASEFKSARQFSAWLGLTPRQNSSGGKEKLGGITKQGDRNIRRLLVVGATALLRRARTNKAASPWLVQLLERKPARLASVAAANRLPASHGPYCGGKRFIAQPPRDRIPPR